MRKEVTPVPKDKCPLDVLAEMGERTKNCQIFLHHTALEKLLHSDGVSAKEGKKLGTLELTWATTRHHPEERVVVDVCGMATDQKSVILISSTDISFTLIPTDPEDLYFLKMED